ncbi:MAG: branched-chain amino acid ABC transporter permease [Alphaproteobacteria bacterium]|nr:branched-chain amino acid ABC transporter permease [Alphaproteobacteria bacterium]
MALLQLLINGLALGAAYALVALGFVLILNATNAVNFAHGDWVMAGGFVAIAMTSLLPADFVAAGTGVGLLLLPGVMALMAVFGLVFCWVAYMPLKRSPPVTVFVSTIAVGIMLTNGINAEFGGAPRAAPPLLGAGRIEIGGLTLSHQSLAILVVAMVLVTGLGLLLERTQLGRRLRAAAQDPDMARALGIRVDRLIAISFALGLALAGAAGLLLANQFFVTPAAGGAVMLKAYIVVTIGGWGRMTGAVAGAMLTALFETVVASLVSQPVAEALLYLALFAILFARPQGLFGESADRRA